MNYFSKKNTVIIVIAVLLIINIATISTILYHSYGERFVKKEQPERNSAEGFWKELNFNQQQIDTFKTMGRQFNQEIWVVMEEMNKIRLELINEMSAANPDTTKMFAMADEIGNKHAEIKRMTINHFIKLKRTYSPEQFDRFVKIFQRILMDDDYNNRGRSERQGRGRRSTNGNGQQQNNK